MSELLTLSGHLNEKLFLQSPNTRQFLAILDAMQEKRVVEIDRFKVAKIFGMLLEKKVLKRFAEEWYVQELYETDNIYYYYCLKYHAYEVFSRKGRMDALVQFLKCFFLPILEDYGTVEVTDYVAPKPAILLNDWEPYDVLPEDQEIYDELNVSPVKYVPTLIDKTWLDFKHQLTIHVVDPTVENNELLEFAKQIVPLFMPMANWPFVVIDIDFTYTI